MRRSRRAEHSSRGYLIDEALSLTHRLQAEPEDGPLSLTRHSHERSTLSRSALMDGALSVTECHGSITLRSRSVLEVSWKCHQRFRIAWSVRPGSLDAMSSQRWPSSLTPASMMASSAGVHPSRGALSVGSSSSESAERERLLPPPSPPLRAGKPGSDCSTCSLRRLQRLRTASSERPGSSCAMCRHLQPSDETDSMMILSSSPLHSFLLPLDSPSCRCLEHT
mmetsp:Transcript_25314/g.59037  ORF Transcript_25314/g.59037 Transcript_25314/m.59037 type:complete len:223 (-) Transcript_25314:1285-1953(-)